MPSQCPKCHQSVEEDYICCADVEFQWKCRSCQKRSRGFAIPFGQCSLCGGELEMMEGKESLKDDQVHLIQEAIQIEITGFHFYRRLSDIVDDPQTSDFFASLSDMEREHIEELSQKYHIHLTESEIMVPVHELLPRPFFEGLCCFEDSGDVTRLYDCAISLEKRTLDFYTDRAKFFPQGEIQNLCLELAAEEREHIQLLESERDRNLQ